MKVVRVDRKGKKIFVVVVDGQLTLRDNGEFWTRWIEIDTAAKEIIYFGAYRSRPSEPWLKAEIFAQTTDEALERLIANPVSIANGIPWKTYQIFPPTTEDLKKLGILERLG